MLSDRELLSAAIEASGLTVTRFCADVLARNPRTIWRWLNGANPLPDAVRRKCEAILSNSG